MSGLRIGSLCSGGGMLDEGVRSVIGGTVAWHCEYEPPTEKNPRPRQAAARVLAHRYPGVPNHGDITTLDWARVESVDALTAGFPCPPVSVAGRRAGVLDERWLFDDILRAVRALGPRLRLCVLENVPGLLTASGGDAMAHVVEGLASVGFVGRYGVLSAAAVGAPHLRERVFIVARPAAADAEIAQWRRWRRGLEAGDPSGRGRQDAGGRDLAADTARDGRDEGRPKPAGLVRGPDAAERRADAAAYAHGQPLRLQPATESRRGGAAVAREASSDAAANPNSKGFGSLGRVDTIGRDADRRSGEDRARAAAQPATQWGAYEPAIRAWEQVLGHPAPSPTETGPKGGQRLSAEFVTWMMGWPAGWVTETPGISRNDALKICGNGVVPQQAAAAVSSLLAAVSLSEAS